VNILERNYREGEAGEAPAGPLQHGEGEAPAEPLQQETFSLI
jgi:hypothetical protein